MYRVHTINRMFVIFSKQKIEIFRNKKMLLMIFIFPIMAFFYQWIESDASQMFLFLAMNTIMPSLTCLASIVSEEREKGTLRALIFAGIKPIEYFISIGLCMGLLNFISTCLIAIIMEKIGGNIINIQIILVISSLGIICSMLIGGIIGLLAKNQINVAPLTAPISLLLAMASMIGTVNQFVHNITQFMYTQIIVDTLQRQEISYTNIAYLCFNIIALLIIFVYIYTESSKVE